MPGDPAPPDGPFSPGQPYTKSDIIMRTNSTSFCSYSGLYSPLCPVKPGDPGVPRGPACPLSHSRGLSPGQPGAPGVPSIPLSPILPGSPRTPDAPAEKVNQYWWTFWDIFRSYNLYLITMKYYFFISYCCLPDITQLSMSQCSTLQSSWSRRSRDTFRALTSLNPTGPHRSWVPVIWVSKRPFQTLDSTITRCARWATNTGAILASVTWISWKSNWTCGQDCRDIRFL